MGTFTGFSEDDIRKLQTAELHKPIEQNKDMIHKKRTTNNKKVTFKNMPKVIVNDAKNKTILNAKLVNSNIPDEARLCPILKQEPTLHDTTNTVTLDNSNNVLEKQQLSSSTENEQNVQEKPKELQENHNLLQAVEDVIKNSNNNHYQTNEKKTIDLKDFEVRQKLIEEQNKRRKELLSKALAARTKRTQEEAKKLEEIQHEFKKLDADLSNDVKILRKQIDLASMEYMEVQKRYVKIEKEFLDMKFLLHQKMEKKEMLTEHLCAIIEKNEERKANKLTELLKKLQLDDDNGNLEIKENSLQNSATT